MTRGGWWNKLLCIDVGSVARVALVCVSNELGEAMDVDYEIFRNKNCNAHFETTKKIKFML